VMLDAKGRVDEAATQARRGDIRAERLAWPQQRRLENAPSKDAPGVTVALAGDRASIHRVGADTFFRCDCGQCIAPANQNWKHYARQSNATAADLGPRIRLHAELEAKRYACPGCGRLHGVEIKLKGEEPLFDSELRL